MSTIIGLVSTFRLPLHCLLYVGRFSPPNSESGGTFCPRSGNIAKIAPISTVIPIILLATVDTSFRKNGHKKNRFLQT